MSAIQAGPSTPSRKRSKWDDDDDEQAQVPRQPPLKRRPKTHSSQVSRPPEAPVESRTTRSTTNSRSARPSHSVYVPPRTVHPPLLPSRSVYSYERLNQIEEGSYGVVFRARDKQSGDIVALKKLKLDEEKHGFPITALREINALMACGGHENVVRVREVVVGDTLTQCVSTVLRLLNSNVDDVCTKSFHCDGFY